MNDQAPPKIPRMKPGVDVRSLPLGAVEGFVLSRIDGATSPSELASLTGLGEARIGEILDKLVGLGAIELVVVTPSKVPPRLPRKTPAGGIPTRDRSGSPTPSRGVVVRTMPPPPGAARALYDPAELEEDVEIDIERRRKVLDTFYQLETLSFYDLLGLPRDADRKRVRAAYFDLAKVFHPDTMFRRRLGSYKPKMEAVFNRLTEAYEVLSKKEGRAEYDAYLALTQSTREAEDVLLEAELAAEAIERESGVPESPASAPRPSEPASPLVTAGIPGEVAPRSPLPPALSPDERRRRAQELLSKRLQGATGGRLRPSGMVPTVAPPAQEPAPAIGRGPMLQDLTRSLKQVAGVTGGADRASRQLAEARRLEEMGDHVGAANGLRLAMAYAPDRADIAAEYARLRKVVAVSLADNYAKQAEYEERQGRFGAAALSWARVCEGRPDDARPHRHVADALLAAKNDIRRAQKYAQRAVDIDGKDAKNRRTLGRVFLEAGLKLNAKRELEAALKLDPGDELVKNLLKEMKD